MNHQSGVMPATPYKGLMPYAEEDAAFFFGREPEREIITANLMAWRLTLLYGPSGVGKSSLLRAGVIHHLRQTAQQHLTETGTPEFAVVVFSAWRDDPLAGLVASVEEAVAQALESRCLEETWFLDPAFHSLTDTLQAATGRLGGDLLIILDQFEEYFLYHPHEDGAGTFAGEFPRAVNRPDLRVSFLIAIREDALAKLDRFKGRVPNLFDNYLRVEHLDREAARAAIEQPVEQYNRLHAADGRQVSIEPALVEAVLDQVRTGQVVVGEAGRGVVSVGSTEARIETPYLQLVMTRLWDEEMRAGSNVLRLATLNRLGGAEEIVERHLDAAMRALPAREQDAAVRIFHHLVTPSGTKIAHTVADLAEYAEMPRAQLTPVLEKLAQPAVRILRPVAPPADRPEEPRYEIFHDVLAPAILDWRARAEAERELTQERRRVTRLRWGVAGLTLLLLAMIALVVFAFQQRAAAQRAKKIAVSRELAAAAINNLDVDPERGVLLALEAVSATYAEDGMVTRQAEETLHRVVPASRVRLRLSGHTGRVYMVAFSPDGNRLATTSQDGTAKVWDISTALNAGATTGRELLTLAGHSDEVLGVSFGPDGARLATASYDGTAKIWDASTGQELLTVAGHDGEAIAVHFSPDGTRLVTNGLYDGMVKIWDATSGEELLSFVAHRAPMWYVALSPDGTRLATASADGTAKVWDAISGRELLTLSGQAGLVSRVAFSPDGTRLATAHEDGTARIWDATSGEELLALPAHAALALWVCFSPDGTRLATGSVDGTVSVWDVQGSAAAAASRKPLTLHGHVGIVLGLAFSPDGMRLATGGYDGTARVWDLSPERELLTLAGHTDQVYTVAFSSDGTRLATGSYDGTAKIWDLEASVAAAAGQALLTLPEGDRTTQIRAVAFSPDGTRLATTSADGTATVWDSASGQKLSTLVGHAVGQADGEAQVNGITGVAFSPDGTRLATASDDGTAKIWDASTGHELLTLVGHAPASLSLPSHNGVVNVAFSPDGTRVATAGADGTARLWDAGNGHELLTLDSHPGSIVVDVAFSPDGSLLATGGYDGTAKVWDLEASSVASTSQPLLTLTGHTSGVFGVAFSPDGTSLATGSEDGTAKVWALETSAAATFGQELLTLYGHTRGILDIAFSPDGNYLATSSQDGTVRLYVLPIEDLVTLAKSRVTRSLTTEECRQYLHVEQCPPTP